jgi:rod shape-determining protein MreC
VAALPGRLPALTAALLVASTAPVAAAAGASDRTVRCAGVLHAGLPVFALAAEPTGPPPAAGTRFPPGFVPAPSLALTTGDRLTLLSVSTAAAGYRLDRSRCRPAPERLALSPRGLQLASTVRFDDAAAISWRCVGLAAVLVRVRITSDGRGIPPGNSRYPTAVAPPNRSARAAVLASSVERSKSNPYPSKARSALVRRIVLTVLVLGALTLLTISFRSPTAGVLHDAQGLGSSALRPFQIAAGRVARPFRDVYGYFGGLASAKSENAKLRVEVRQLRAQASANKALAAKATGLEKLLRYEQGPTYPKGYRAVNTSVTSFPAGPFTQQIAIAAGSNQGIRINTPVVTGDGLVGRVTNVYPRSAVVTLLTDANSYVSARDLKTGVRGLIRHGQGNTLILDQVAKQVVVNKGDELVTDGTRDARYPDLYPYGIPIGTVSSVGIQDTASFLQVQVEPYANLGSLDSVAALVATKGG